MAAAAAPGGPVGPARLPALCSQRLGQFLRQVDDTDLVWLEEIREEAIRMFCSHYSDEPELMPKTPSQKNRQRRKRFSALREEDQELGRKRLSRRRNSSLKQAPSARCSQRQRNKDNLELSRAEAAGDSSTRRVTRSQTAALAKRSEILPEAPPETPPQQRAVRKVPLVEISINDCISAELRLPKSRSKPAEQLSTAEPPSPGGGCPQDRGVAESPEPSRPPAPPTPQPAAAEETEAASWPQAADATFILSEGPGQQEGDGGAGEPCEQEPPRGTPGTPTSCRRSRRSVRRSLLEKPSLSRRTSLAEKYSLASRRESALRQSLARASRRRTAQKLTLSSSHSCLDASSSGEVPEDEETVVKAGPPPGPCTPPKQSPRTSLRPRDSGRKEQQEPSASESNLNKNGESQEPPQSARRKPSYKRAVDERYDSQQAEEGGLSPLRRKTPSPTFPASKVVRPFKTFLHTVQKNQLLMTPSSVGRNGVIKSFIRSNTPVQSNYKEKERQKLETLRKKQEAEQLRKQKLEEEKKRRLEEAKLKREERLRKVLLARERVEQAEQQRKRRIEQKIALFDEKTEKVREERLLEEKIKKKAAARKMEEAEARRRQEEEARRQRALQQEEEEERRHRELMQKRKEEEQERARKIAEQRQAEQEREKQLAAQRELERKKQQERIQAEKLHEQQKAAQLQKEALAAQQQLHREMEEKEQQKQRLAELQRQEQEEKNLPEEQKASPTYSLDQVTPQDEQEEKGSPNPNSYGMDLNSDDSTDDESHPRKPVPAWAMGNELNQAIIQQYYNPPNVDAIFGAIPSPRLEDIFYKRKPRYFKRTSSAVWSSPPIAGSRPARGVPYSLKKY